MRARLSISIAFAAVLACLSPSAQACAACFGKSDSAMAHGMNMGIFSLLAVITCVLAGIASFGVYTVRRASKLAAASEFDQADPEASPVASSSPQGEVEVPTADSGLAPANKSKKQ